MFFNSSHPLILLPLRCW